MKIIWHGHACFEIKSKEGNIVFDPYADGSVPGLHIDELKADRVYASHGHGDHNAFDKVQLLSRDVDLKVDTIHSYHDDVQGTLRGPNVIHIAYLEGMKIVHLGDIGCDIDNDLLKDCDVFMIPVGGHYTIDAKMAKHLIDKYNPRIVIPMHYRGDHFGYDVISTVDEFLTYFDHVIEYDSCSIEITEETTKQIALLKI